MGNKKKKKKHKENNNAVCPEEMVTQVIPVLPDVTEGRALSAEEEDDILDAKIRAGINEAAEEFKKDLEIEAVGDEIADEMNTKPVETIEEIQTAEAVQAAAEEPETPAAVQTAATEAQEAPVEMPEAPVAVQATAEEPETPAAVQTAMPEARNMEAEQERVAEIKKEEEKTMEEKRTMNGQEERVDAEVKTVYIREKQSIGWWKIVMLVLASVVTLCFVVTACLAGAGLRTLKTLAETSAAYSVEDHYGNGFDPYGSYGNGPGNYIGYDDNDNYDNYEDFWNYFNNENSRTENSEDANNANENKPAVPDEKQEEGSSGQNKTEDNGSDTEAMKDLINGLFGIIDGLGIR